MQRLKGHLAYEHTREQEVYHRIKESLTVHQRLIFVSELLGLAAERFGSRKAVVCKRKSVTYAELYFRATQLGVTLQDLGVKPHDRVVLYLENSPEFYVFYYAIWQLGAVCVPLNVFLHEREVATILADADPKVIVASSEKRPFIEKLKTFGAFESFPPLLTEQDIDWSSPVPRSCSAIKKLLTPVVLDADSLCVLLYTSGTTGTSKGVMLSSRNVVTNAMQCLSRLCMHNNLRGHLLYMERFFAALPLFHAFAQNSCMWMPLLGGSTVIVVPRIDRREILEGLREKPTIFFGVPALYGFLCLLKTAPLDQVNFFVSGGDALPDRIRAAFGMVYGRKICSGYGLTEASPVVAVNLDNAEHRTNVVGSPLIGIDCDIRDSEGNSRGIGEVGELWLRGDNIMQGYYHAPEATAEVLRDGWLRTGDLASIDAEGKITLIGRSKDLIIHKGFNIYPQEVENVLMSHPAVFKAAVVGRDDATTGQVPVAFVALNEESHKNMEKILRDFCGGYLARYKIPKKIVCLDDLPMNQTGKIDKKTLQTDLNEP